MTLDNIHSLNSRVHGATVTGEDHIPSVSISASSQFIMTSPGHLLDRNLVR